MTITLTWWMIPTLITLVGLFWALVWVREEGCLGFLTNMFALIPVFAVSLVAWIVAGVLK